MKSNPEDVDTPDNVAMPPSEGDDLSTDGPRVIVSMEELEVTGSKHIKISRIVEDDSLFVREGLNADAVERYKELYQNGVELPPLTIQEETFLLLDGWHRRQALLEIGREFALVRLVRTDRPYLVAFQLNETHGVPYSKSERNAAIIRMYNSENMTQAEIGQVVGLSQKRVSEILALVETTNPNNTDKRSTLNDADRQALIQRILQGKKQTTIAKEFSIEQPRVSQIQREFISSLREEYTFGIPIEYTHERLLESGLKFSLVQHRRFLTNDDNIVLWHLTVPRVILGDLFEYINRIPDESIDLIYADPPFNITKEDWDRFESKQKFIDFTRKWLQAVLPKLKRSGRFLVSFSQQYLFEFYQLMQELLEECDLEFAHLIVWHHPNNVEQLGKRDFKRTWDPIFYYRRPDAGQIFMNQGVSWEGSPGDFDVWKFAQPQTNFVQDTKLHPTQKPLGLLKHIVETLTQKGDMILDPFAGAGTTAVACIGTGRNYVVIEREAEYIELIKERILNAVR